MLPLWLNREFVLLQAGQLLSSVGTSSTGIAYPLLVLAVTPSPARAGLVGFARLIPYALFGLPAGVAADRWNRKHVMIAADGVRVVAIGSLAATILLHRVAFWQIPIVAFVEGTGAVAFGDTPEGARRGVAPRRLLRSGARSPYGR